MAEEEKIFKQINGLPISGITLQTVLKGHNDRIGRIAWSPDGQYLASPSDDGTVIIWNIASAQEIRKLESSTPFSDIYCVGWSPNMERLASGSRDNDIRIWEVKTGKLLSVLNAHTSLITSINWSPDGQMLASSADDEKIIIWSTTNDKLLRVLGNHESWVTSVVWSPNGRYLASGSADATIRIWDTRTWECLRILQGHHGRVTNLTWAPNEKEILSASYDATIRIWDFETGQEKLILEGHGATVRSMSFSFDGKVLASNSWDSTIRLWRCSNWELIGSMKVMVSDNWAASLAFNPKKPLLATLGNYDSLIYIWELNIDAVLESQPKSQVRYTTAKLVLVGDSGVGKTGLGWRLAHNEFKEHSSTHGQQFWVVPELKKTREDGTECEAVLWDLAGQHIYRSINSIFLDNVDASLVLFDPSNRQEPLKGAQFWLEQLKGKKHLPPTVLVGARLDRGAPVLSRQELDQFCQQFGVSGGYIGTSAKSGEGIDKLVEALNEQIPWDLMTTTVTTVTFKRIKDYLGTLKEKTDRKGVLVTPDDLRKQLQATDKDWKFTDDEMMTAVGHLANFGLITILKSSSGDGFILLVPELLPSVAASIFLHADKHPRELGSVNETQLLQGKYPIDEFKGLEEEEQQVLLNATVVRFLEHNLCFREKLSNDNLLIFPSLIKQKRPLKDDITATDDISYIVRGRVENIYASLVALLGYTSSFTRVNQWANQAQYETEDEHICGFRLVEDREGEIELILYYGDDMPAEERIDFQALFEQFLYQREVDVTPFPPVTCPNGHRQERATVVKRLREGKKSIFCDECGAETKLPDLEAQSTSGFEAPDWLKQEEAKARLRNLYETQLVNIKGYRRDWAAPRCYFSFVEEQNDFAEKLAHDLADAGVYIVEEASKVEASDSILIIDSSSYKDAWENNKLPDSKKLIQSRLADSKNNGLIYIDRSGLIVEHNLESCVSKSFCDPTHYVINLFDLVLNLYAIPLNHAGFVPLRQALHTQWEQTLAQKMDFIRMEDNKSPSNANKKEIFFSYAWRGESEKIVNEIDQAFQKRGVTIIRDKRNLDYKGSIKEFMKQIGRGQGVVVVISDKYLKSKNCMFELIQIAQNKQFKDRIFPVVLGDADIYDAVKRVKYIQYWESKKKELDEAIKSVSSEHLQGITDEMNLYDDIRDEIANLTNILQDMNTLTSDMHRDSDFQILFDNVMEKLEE